MRSLEVTEAILVSAVVKLVEVLGTQFCHQKTRKVARQQRIFLGTFGSAKPQQQIFTVVKKLQ